MKYFHFILVGLLGLVSCGPDHSADPIVKSADDDPKHVNLPPPPTFSEDSAYSYIQRQVDFGPRVPGTASHEKCAKFLAGKLKEFNWEVQFNGGSATLTNGKKIVLKNIIGSFNPEIKDRILLMAHWDTRSRADRDSVRKSEPIDGADDGASGVGVLLELARQLTLSKPTLGVDIIFFDAEDDGDYGSDESWCLGSQYWSKNLHVPGYNARYGILLDMVGSKGATFPREGYSRMAAANVVKKIWNKAAHLGYSDYFLFKDAQAITDDHVFVIQNTNIPCVDIINMNMETGDFGHYHHRHSDNMKVIDKNTLKAVGQTVLSVIWEEQKIVP